MTKPIDLLETVDNFKYDPLVKVESDGSEVRMLQPATKADILREAIPLLQELSKLHEEKCHKKMKEPTVKGFINYIQSLLEEKS